MTTNLYRSYKLALLIQILCFAACSTSEKFDTHKWKNNHVDFTSTDARERMLDDLFESKILFGKTIDEVIELIGKPNTKSTIDEVMFLVREKYGSNIDPIYMKYIVVKFDSDGLSISQRIEQNGGLQ